MITRRKAEAEFGKPFYALPPRKTSAEIIREAKYALEFNNQAGRGLVSRVGVKTIHTRRPFTPRARERTLFGVVSDESVRDERPPSSFAISSLKFDPADSGNRASGLSAALRSVKNCTRLLPILSITGDDCSLDSSFSNRRLLRQQFRAQTSLSDLPEENEQEHDGTKRHIERHKKSLSFDTCNSLINNKDERHLNYSKNTGAVPKHINTTVHTNKSNEINETSYEEKISPVLDEIQRAVDAGIDEEILSEIVEKLYNNLEAAQFLGKKFEQRSLILKTIFSLVDRNNPKLLANLTRLLLALKVSGNNLTSACKLVFKITRQDTNDTLFMEGNLLDLVLEAVACASPTDQAEACIYGYGALKFLTTNSKIGSRLLYRGLLELLVLHMKLILNQKEEKGFVSEKTGYALVQLTGTLRHVSSCDKAFKLLLVTGAVNAVCNLFIAFHEEPDVTANLARVLSIISTDDNCCVTATRTPGIMETMVLALGHHSDRGMVVVRLAYALGNMMATDDDSRKQLFNTENFPDIILTLLSDYIQRDRDDVDYISDNNDSTSTEDVLIKLVRVMANISVEATVGEFLSNSDDCFAMLVSLINHKSVEENEELVLSVLATLNNLTFYARLRQPSSLQMQLAENLCEILPIEHVEGLIEVIRVFGNLTHSKQIRDILVQKNMLPTLTEMLDCDARELVFVCVGVLVNLMTDSEKRKAFAENDAIEKLIDVLQYFGYGDWQLCSLICQAFWNYSASQSNILAAIPEKQAAKLALVLEEFLDEDNYLQNPELFIFEDQTNTENLFEMWQEFASVAMKLLDRLEEKINVQSTDEEFEDIE